MAKRLDLSLKRDLKWARIHFGHAARAKPRDCAAALISHETASFYLGRIAALGKLSTRQLAALEDRRFASRDGVLRCMLASPPAPRGYLWWDKDATRWRR